MNAKNTHTKTKLAAAVFLALGSTAANALHLEMFDLGGGKSNFTMLGPTGGRVGGTNDVTITWDGSLNTSVADPHVNMTISSPTTFFGQPWFANNVQVFGPGSYTFEACLDDGSKIGTKACGNPNYDPADPSTITNPLAMNVGANQIGVHMLFNWNGNNNIDVVNVWDKNALWGFAPNGGTTKSYLEGADLGCFPSGGKKGGNATSPECTNLFATQWMFASTDVNGSGVPGSGMVDGPFIGFNANFNVSNVSPVPVPAAVWLMGSGLLGLVGVARRKKH